MNKNKKSKISLQDLGYDQFVDSNFKILGLDNSAIARVISEYKELYQVKNADGEYLGEITGKQRFDAKNRSDFPAVGDWVVIKKIDSEKTIIKNILPRKTVLQKKYSNKKDIQIIATNIDVAFIVESLDRDYNLNRFERYVVLAQEGKIKPVIILNKIDLVSEAELFQKIKQIENRFHDIEIFTTSTLTGYGLDDLVEFISKGKMYCFLGSSGVGKSSLINKLLKQNIIKTKEIGVLNKRGKHTTTAREMYFLENGGILIDNPGTREIGMINVDTGINSTFDDIASLSKKCKYADCTHTQEPGCAVTSAVKNNLIDNDKYQNYIRLKKENEFHQMTDFEKREKNKKFGKFIKKSQEQLKKYKFR